MLEICEGGGHKCCKAKIKVMKGCERGAGKTIVRLENLKKGQN